MAEVLEERSFPSTDIRLLDDAVAEGVLTEAGGEPIIIQGTNEDSFDGVRFAFFTGGAEFTERHWEQALRGGATVIDLSGALRGEAKCVPWIPALRKRLPPPRTATGKLFVAPPAPVIIACTLAAAAREAGAERLAIVFFQPVSERGQAGIEELESQTVSLLSLKPIAKELYGEQVAFNFLSGYGAAGQETLAGVRAQICAGVEEYLDGRVPAPAIQLLQAPVFHGYAFTAFVDFPGAPKLEALQAALESLGVRVAVDDSDSPSNVSVAGESQILLARMEAAPGTRTSCWLWGAADNLRLGAANAVSIAETLLAS